MLSSSVYVHQFIQQSDALEQSLFLCKLDAAPVSDSPPPPPIFWSVVYEMTGVATRPMLHHIPMGYFDCSEVLSATNAPNAHLAMFRQRGLASERL